MPQAHENCVGSAWLLFHTRTMVQNSLMSQHVITHLTTSSGWVSERASEQMNTPECTREWVSGASERANGWAGGPVLMSRFSVALNHSYSSFFMSLYWPDFPPQSLTLFLLPFTFFPLLSFFHFLAPSVFPTAICILSVFLPNPTDYPVHSSSHAFCLSVSLLFPPTVHHWLSLHRSESTDCSW